VFWKGRHSYAVIAVQRINLRLNLRVGNILAAVIIKNVHDYRYGNDGKDGRSAIGGTAFRYQGSLSPTSCARVKFSILLYAAARPGLQPAVVAGIPGGGNLSGRKVT